MPFKAACEEIYVKEKMWKRHRTPMQIKLMYDNHPGRGFGSTSIDVKLTAVGFWVLNNSGASDRGKVLNSAGVTLCTQPLANLGLGHQSDG
jgi:hypothetical protein